MAETLYERLGGQESIGAVVDLFYRKVLADDRIAHHFANTDMEAQRRHQTAFLSFALGGPAYSGRRMEKAHEGMNLQPSDWDAVVDDLAASLREAGVGEDEIGQVVDRLATLKSSVLYQ